MVRVEAGEFVRGPDDHEIDDEKPVRKIYLDAFEIGKYPVTNHEFKAFVDDKGYYNKELWTPEGWEWRKRENISEPELWHDRKWNGPNFPVVGVSWYEASAYVEWLSRKTGEKYTLPTEAQWEKAARGSTSFIYPWGNAFNMYRCNSTALELYRTNPVGIFHLGASPYGCLDMAGNVREWCTDRYKEDYYKESPYKNPEGPSTGSYRVFRGGGWRDNAQSCQSSRRGYLRPDIRGDILGFRLVRPAAKLNLPVDIHTFDNMITGNYLYVDKTKYIYNFFKHGIYYFLSRPRKFGKSLLVSTLKEIFAGNKDLFRNLWIYDRIPWEKYPIIHIDFLGHECRNKEELTKTIEYILDENAKTYGIKLKEKGYDKKFHELIIELSKIGKVVILIDEYDKPIIDIIEKQRLAEENRDILKTFYETLKGAEDHLKFVFITGVSKFSRVSIFSGLNNLIDISLSDEYAVLLGYTEQEMEIYFNDEITGLAEKLKIAKDEAISHIRNWYNGYSWDGENFVYNPFSILCLFKHRLFKDYWFSSGTPTFLIKFIRESGKGIPELERLKTSGYLFEQFDIGNIDVETLLFQTGYLTIKERKILPSLEQEYILTYPNREVRESFLVYLLKEFTRKSFAESEKFYRGLKDAVNADDLERFFEIMKSFFGSIPSSI